MKKIILLLLVGLFMMPLACGNNSSPTSSTNVAAPTTDNVYYTITGTTGFQDILSYTLPSGSYASVTVSVPYTSPTYVFQKGTAVAIASYYYSGGIGYYTTLNIYCNGSLSASNSTTSPGNSTGCVLP